MLGDHVLGDHGHVTAVAGRWRGGEAVTAKGP